MICLPCACEGINVMKRKIAEHDNLKVTIEQTGDKFHIKESSTFRTKEIDFTLGVQFDYTLADGTEVSVSGRGPRVWAPHGTKIPANPSKNHGVFQSQGTWEMEGDTLKGKFTRKDNDKVLTTTRSLVGGELVQVSTAWIIFP